jgi:GNAT superfamily N-acetyltransferase
MRRMLDIHHATLADGPTIVEFQLAMALESEGVILDRDTLTAGVAAVLDGRADAVYWVAVEDGAIKGMLMAVPEWSDWRNGTVLWVHSVFVRPYARRRGVFTAMYRHLRDLVERSPELMGLRLYVDKQNEAAKRVYESLGMSREHYELYEWMDEE